MGFWQFATGGGSGGGTGDVVGPASSVDDQIAVFDGVTGKLLSASAATLTAAGSLTIPSAETIEFSTDTGIARSAAGIVKSTDGANGLGSFLVTKTNGTRGIYFGGTTSSDAGFGYTTAAPGINVLLGDGSDWARLTASGFYLTNSNNFIATNSNRIHLAADSGAYLTDEAGSEMRWLHAAVEVEANTAGSGTPNVIAISESTKVFTNEGATAKNYEALPTAAAGYQYTFIVQDADGMRIVANTDDTIRVIDKVTAAAGYIESTTIGSTVTLVSINAVEWYATSINGVWTDGTFTYDDTSLTTP